MKEMKPETVLPTLAVSAWKHRAFVAAQAAVVRLALVRAQEFVTSGAFSPGDLPEDTVSAEDRQGVMSNAFNMLRAAEIIERLPLGYTSEAQGIFGGRTRNKNPGAKGRWCACYRLRSRSLALAWLERNGCAAAPEPVAAVQEEMAL